MTAIDESPLDAAKLEQFVFRAVDEVGRHAQRRAGGDGRPARPLPGARRRRRAHVGRAGGPHRYRRALRTGVAERPGGRRLRRLPRRPGAATACRPSRRSRSPTRTAPPTCRGSSRSRSAPSWTRQRITEAARRATGSAGTSTTTTSTTAASGSSAPATTPTSSQSWLPALDGVVERLERGARVADVGCGHGASTILMAERLPELDLRRLGLPRRLDRRPHASGRREAGVADRVRFEIGPRDRRPAARATTS